MHCIFLILGIIFGIIFIPSNFFSRPSELESQQSREGGGTSSKEDSFEYPDENEEIATASDNNNVDENASGNGAAISKRNNADQFLVCVFNVSSKVSYSILQVKFFRRYLKTNCSQRDAIANKLSPVVT
jgi:hypothetical protein